MKHPKVIIPIQLVDVRGCVYRLWYNGKYIVVMARSMWRSIDSINQDLERFYRGVNEEKNKNNLYFKFYKHVLDEQYSLRPKNPFEFEMILESEKPYRLLVACQKELDKSRTDPMCLNSDFFPYINKDMQKPVKLRKAVWWVNRGAYLNFRNWQKKRQSS